MIWLAIKIVDEIILTGTDLSLRKFMNGFGSAFKLGEVIHDTRVLRFFPLHIIINIMIFLPEFIVLKSLILLNPMNCLEHVEVKPKKISMR